MIGHHEIQILVAEDNPGDARLLFEAFKEWKRAHSVHLVKDGQEAIDFLYREGMHKDASTPDLIFLDLNMPKKSGQEVLTQIKQDQNLRRIPVIILTTSAAEVDILKAYDQCANSFMTKPIDFDRFVDAMKEVGDYWLSTVKLPDQKARI